MEGGHRTNNSCEAWNHGFRQMVGHDHPSVWVALECLQKDHALVSTQLLQSSRGELPQKRVRMATVSLQKKLKQLCTEFQGQQKTLPEFLHACGSHYQTGLEGHENWNPENCVVVIVFLSYNNSACY